MYSKKAIVVSPLGLYAKSAASFIQLANRFKSVIFLEYEERKANAKSLLGVLSLALSQNCEVLITAEGVDEEEAGETLANYISSGCPDQSDDDNVSTDDESDDDNISTDDGSNDDNVSTDDESEDNEVVNAAGDISKDGKSANDNNVSL